MVSTTASFSSSISTASTRPQMARVSRAEPSKAPFIKARSRAPRVADASPIRIEVVRKTDNPVGFAVIARRWVVERFFAWINRNRRLAKDFEAKIEIVEAFLYAASRWR